MTAGEKLPVDDPVVIDLDALDDEDDSPSARAIPIIGPGGTGHPADPSGPDDRTDPADRDARRRRIGLALLLVGALAIGAFLGNTNARTAAQADTRLFVGNIVMAGLSTGADQWDGALVLINDGAEPVDVLGLELPGFVIEMAQDAVTVPEAGRRTLPLTIAADCDAAPAPGGETPPLTVTLAGTGTERTVESPVSIAPDGTAAWLRAECRRDTGSSVSDSTLEVLSVPPTGPADTLPGRLSVHLPGDDLSADLTSIRSLVPGFTISTDTLPVVVASRARTTFVEISWAIDDCAAAAGFATDRLAATADVAVTLRTDVDDAVQDTLIQTSVPGDVAFQLGALAAASCPP